MVRVERRVCASGVLLLLPLLLTFKWICLYFVMTVKVLVVCVLFLNKCVYVCVGVGGIMGCVKVFHTEIWTGNKRKIRKENRNI